ncbi:hypothetical protein [Streptomyces sp. CBMA156]|uniref:hypothetical protein n=1 Tax=Streptomyces sp. CBMA156 TaxID=1930280 RepID=UPI0016619917|nr:hypothetical protein [Streptomyces sp. CBMA156]
MTGPVGPAGSASSAGSAGPVGSPDQAGRLGPVVRVYRRFRPLPRRARLWVHFFAVAVALAACLVLGEWWPAPVLAAAAVVAVSEYERLWPSPGLRSVRVHEGGLVLVSAGGGEESLPWSAVEATEYSPGGPCGEHEHGRIWPAGAEEPLVLAHLRGLAGLFRESEERLSPGLRAALHETLRTEGSVRFARGRLTVTAGGLVHRPPHPLAATEAHRWAEVHSARASDLGELEIRTRPAGLPLTFPVPNARAAADFLEDLRAAAAIGWPPSDDHPLGGHEPFPEGITTPLSRRQFP